MKAEYFNILDTCNSVIKGSKHIINSIDNQKRINVDKALKASTLSIMRLAVVMKQILEFTKQNDTYGPTENNKYDNFDFRDILNTFKGK
jgi:hypothetical protein